MSAFVVTMQTINRVVNAIDYSRSKFGRKFAGRTFTEVRDLQELGEDLISMNIAAVVARYGRDDAEATWGLAHTYDYRPMQPNRVQALKSISCLLYQCSEGNVPEQPLFKALKELENNLAFEIISDLPEWDAAEWDEAA